MLDNCGLIVVDELQMLSSPDRGPKMEFSIMKVLETQQEALQDQEIRIIGLTTSESDVERLCKWLSAEKLGNDVRPVGLKEYFVSYNPVNRGEYFDKDTPGENWTSDNGTGVGGQTTNIEKDSAGQTSDAGGGAGQASDTITDIGGQALGSGTNDGEQKEVKRIEIPSDASSMRRKQDDDKKRCFFAILGKWLDTNSKEGGKKILIFNNTKRNSRILATEIAARFPLFTCPEPLKASSRKELKDALDHALQEFSDEEDVNELSRLISHGIAFHHSGLPSTVREAIERDFRDQSGQIQVIVCTETLMIGVNLPADVVILYDSAVFRGASKPFPLTLQEYKNFIGRAGRLGYSNVGESYMLTDRLKADVKKYTSDKKTEIVSPFKKDNDREIAPYFMSWIGSETDVDLRIRQGLEQGFCCNQRKDDAEYIENFSKRILQWMQRLRMVDTDGAIISIVQEDHRGLDRVSKLTQFGTAMAPYALTLNTDAILLDYVIKNREKLHIDGLQFKTPHTARLLPPGSLLELLYTICQCTEVDQNPALQLPADEKTIHALDVNAKRFLRGIYPVCPTGSVQNEGNRPLAWLTHMQCVMEVGELRPAVRAIVLALWMAGCSIRTIRDSTNFNISISTSDVERLSESVAYLMEALGGCQKILGMDEKDFSGMRILSNSMKYGVPRSLVSLANTHARGITRPLLLKTGERADKAGKTAIEYVMASTDDRYRTLREALREREHVHSYAQQLENKSLDIPDRFRKLIPALQGLDTNQNQDCALNHQNLIQFFKNLSDTSSQDDCAVQASCLENENIIQVQFHHEGRTVQLFFQTLRPILGDDNEWTKCVSQFIRTVQEMPVSAQIPTQAITVLCGTPPAGEENLPGDHLVISSEMLGVLLLACLLENSDKTGRLIYRILSDLKGPFILGGQGFFNEYGQIWQLVKGYAHKEIDTRSVRLPQLYYYPGIFDYKHSMVPEEKPQYAEVTWGQPELDSHCENRASFYHPAMRYSRMSESVLQNSSIIFCSVENLPEVQQFHNAVISEKDPDKEMDVILRELAHKLRPAMDSSSCDIGISFRSSYQAQMYRLKSELERREKNVLCMNTDDFQAEMAGDDLISRLTDKFSSCRHIIVCDTEDYDESPYTFTEYNVVLDKLAYALKHHQGVPVYRVRIPGVSESRKMANCFRYSFSHTYDDAKVDELADLLIQQMNKVERVGRDIR